MTDNKLIAVVVVCIMIVLTSVSTASMVKSYLALEAVKVKAEEGHKFKFGITKEKNDETK